VHLLVCDNNCQSQYFWIMVNYFVYLYYSDLFLRTHFRMHLITLSDTLTHTHTLGWKPLDEGSVRRTDLYLTTHNTHKRQTSISPAEFEPAVPASDRPQSHALDRAGRKLYLHI
jgi:hypothetical protein